MSSRRVALVGNSTFPLDASTGGQVVSLIREWGDDVTLLTRKRPPFDAFVQSVAIVLKLRCLTYDAEGGASNLARDSAIVDDCTELHGFLTLEEFEQGEDSGTFWLISKALAANKPTYAWTCADGMLIHVGSEEPE